MPDVQSSNIHNTDFVSGTEIKIVSIFNHNNNNTLISFTLSFVLFVSMQFDRATGSVGPPVRIHISHL